MAKKILPPLPGDSRSPFRSSGGKTRTGGRHPPWGRRPLDPLLDSLRCDPQDPGSVGRGDLVPAEKDRIVRDRIWGSGSLYRVGRTPRGRRRPPAAGAPPAAGRGRPGTDSPGRQRRAFTSTDTTFRNRTIQSLSPSIRDRRVPFDLQERTYVTIKSKYLVITLIMTCWFVVRSPMHLNAQEPRPTHQAPISFLLNENTTVPERLFLDLLDGMEDRIARFEVTSGKARFDNGSRVILRAAENGRVLMPGIVAGPAGDESFVEISVDGSRIISDLRIATLHKRMISALKQLLRTTDELGEDSILVVAEDYIIIDEEKLDLGRIEAIGGPKGDHQHLFLPNSFYEPDFDCGSGCVRSPAPPGLVNWEMPDPWGSGFSVKPEHGDNVLLVASPPQQAIDGIYNSSWGAAGCGLALKVPGSCTANVQSISSLYCCCNAFMRLLGYECRWVDPRELGDWRDCAL